MATDGQGEFSRKARELLQRKAVRGWGNDNPYPGMPYRGFIHELRRHFPRLSDQQFNDYLNGARLADHVRLARADLVQAMNPQDVARSERVLERGTLRNGPAPFDANATFHFVELGEHEPPAAPRGRPASSTRAPTKKPTKRARGPVGVKLTAERVRLDRQGRDADGCEWGKGSRVFRVVVIDTSSHECVYMHVRAANGREAKDCVRSHLITCVASADHPRAAIDRRAPAQTRRISTAPRPPFNPDIVVDLHPRGRVPLRERVPLGQLRAKLAAIGITSRAEQDQWLRAREKEQKLTMMHVDDPRDPMHDTANAFWTGGGFPRHVAYVHQDLGL